MASIEASTKFVAIALHDVSPATQPMCERLLHLVHSICPQAPLTLLVVPRWHGQVSIADDPAWRQRLDRLISRGSEVALHGFFHLDTGPVPRSPSEWIGRYVLSAGEAEFAALDAIAARHRIEMGLELLSACHWPAAGFVPPAWRICREAHAALARFHFEYTTTSNSITHLPSGRQWRVPCLVMSVRTWLRRRLSVAWAKTRASALANERFLRIALHPAEACYDSTLETWKMLLEVLLCDRRAVTKSALCGTLMQAGALPAGPCSAAGLRS